MRDYIKAILMRRHFSKNSNNLIIIIICEKMNKINIKFYES